MSFYTLHLWCKGMLSLCVCMQQPEGLETDPSFTISIESESLSQSLSESIQALFSCAQPIGSYILMKFGTLGPRKLFEPNHVFGNFSYKAALRFLFVNINQVFAKVNRVFNVRTHGPSESIYQIIQVKYDIFIVLKYIFFELHAYDRQHM